MYVAIDSSEILDVGDESVRVGGHVHAEEARLVRNWVSHGGREVVEDAATNCDVMACLLLVQYYLVPRGQLLLSRDAISYL